MICLRAYRFLTVRAVRQNLGFRMETKSESVKTVCLSVCEASAKCSLSPRDAHSRTTTLCFAPAVDSPELRKLSAEEHDVKGFSCGRLRVVSWSTCSAPRRAVGNEPGPAGHVRPGCVSRATLVLALALPLPESRPVHARFYVPRTVYQAGNGPSRARTCTLPWTISPLAFHAYPHFPLGRKLVYHPGPPYSAALAGVSLRLCHWDPTSQRPGVNVFATVANNRKDNDTTRACKHGPYCVQLACVAKISTRRQSLRLTARLNLARMICLWCLQLRHPCTQKEAWTMHTSASWLPTSFPQPMAFSAPTGRW